MSLTPPAAPIRKLAIGATAAGAYRHVFAAFPQFMKAVAFPFLVTAAAYVSLNSAHTSVMDSLTSVQMLTLLIVSYVVLLVPQALFALIWHRFTLLGPTAAPLTWLPRLKTSDAKFFVNAFIIVVLTTAPITIFAMIDILIIFSLLSLKLFTPLSIATQLIVIFVLTYGIFLVGPFIAVRFSFIFPATAVRERYGFRDAWAHTRGQFLRLVAVCALTIVPGELALGIAETSVHYLVYGERVMVSEEETDDTKTTVHELEFEGGIAGNTAEHFIRFRHRHV